MFCKGSNRDRVEEHWSTKHTHIEATRGNMEQPEVDYRDTRHHGPTRERTLGVALALGRRNQLTNPNCPLWLWVTTPPRLLAVHGT